MTHTSFATWSVRFLLCGTVLGLVRDASGGQAAAVRPPGSLTATAASKSAVTLTWTSGDGSHTFIVERKAAGAAWPAANATPSATLATVETATVTDSKIDPFATYVYRVRAQGAAGPSAPSNEVTVGPPPTGFSQIVATPKAIQDHSALQFAGVISVALDDNGDPAIAYLVNDLDNNGEPDDSVLEFVSWNRARYRWNAPVRVATVGDVARAGTRPAFSLAIDGTQAALAYLVRDVEVQIAKSADAGATWTSALVQRNPPEEAGLASPALAIDGGKAYLAYFSAGAHAVFRSGNLADNPATWSTAKPPALPGTGETKPECLSVAVDSNRRPVMTYCLEPADGYNTTLAFWRPGQAPVKVLDTQNQQTDDPGARLAVSGTRMAVAFYGARDDRFFNGHHAWLSTSSNSGATWSVPALAADDGGHEMVAPLSVALDRAGHAVMGAAVGGGNGAASKCGQPKLMRSADGTAWTTCAPATRGVAETAGPRHALVLMAGNDKVYQVFHTLAASGALAPGLVLWREN